MTLLESFVANWMKHPSWHRWIDSFLGLFLVFPSMLFYWRGIWDLMGIYFLPNSEELFRFSMMTTVGLGAIISYAFLPVLSRYINRDRKVIFFILTRVQMYLHGLLGMFYWRGIWSLSDHFLLPFKWKAGVAGLIVCYGSLMLMMSSRSVIFTPFSIGIDAVEHVLTATTCLETEYVWGSKSSAMKYALDSLLTQYVIVTLTILTWRSAFSLLDEFIFPTDEMLSNLFCLSFGFAISIVLFALEGPFSQVARRIYTGKGQFARTLWENLVHVVVFANMTFLWRGAWNLNSKYMIEDPLIGGWVNHVIGTILLTSLQVLQIVGGCGCPVDGSNDVTSPGGLYHTEYLRKLIDAKYEQPHEVKTVRETNILT